MVFSTLQHPGRGRTINRIIAVFPPPEQKQVRLQLAAILRASSAPPGEARRHRGPRACGGSHDNTAFIRECILVPEKTALGSRCHRGRHIAIRHARPSTIVVGSVPGNLIGYETLSDASNADDFKLRMQVFAVDGRSHGMSMQSAGFGGR